MTSYMIFNYNILDRRKIDELTEKLIDKKYGAEVIVRSRVKPVEGQTLANMVIDKFSDFESAKN